MLVDALIGLLSRGLYLLPAGLTGRVRGTAKQLVREALSKNATGQELRFNLLERLLLVGGNHPLVFALGVGLLSAAVAWVTLPLPQFGWPGLPAPKLPDDFTLAGFFWLGLGRASDDGRPRLSDSYHLRHNSFAASRYGQSRTKCLRAVFRSVARRNEFSPACGSDGNRIPCIPLCPYSQLCLGDCV